MPVGIDIGTQSCRVAVWSDGHPTIVADEEGNRSFPSYVSFSNDGRLVGALAKSKQTANVKQTVYGVKRLLGRSFRDFEVQDILRTLPFRSINKGGTPYIQVEHFGKDEIFAPEEIIAMQISKLKTMAEKHLGGDCGRVVVSIPPSFNILQRQAVTDACEIAGLKSAYLTSETSASALYYALYSRESKVPGERKVLVLDVGAGVTSAGVMLIEEGVVEVKAASSNLQLGGDDFDDALADYVATDIRRKHSIDVKDNPRSLARMRSACERAKRALSGAQKAIIDIEGVSQDIPQANSTISRDEFDFLCKDLFQAVLKPVKRALRQSGIKGHELHEVVLTGGATRMPGLIATLTKYLGDFTPPPISIRNLDEAVAYGCAVRSAMHFYGEEANSWSAPDVFHDMILLDVLSHSLGIAVLRDRDPQALPPDGSSPHENVLKKVIPRNATTCIKKTEVLTSAHVGMTTVHVQVYEGEDDHPASNVFLGSFELSQLRVPYNDHGQNIPPVVEVEFDLDSECDLVVTAKDVGNPNHCRRMPIRVGRLSQFAKDDMKFRAKTLDEMDRSLESRTRRRNNLEEYCYNSHHSIDDLRSEVDGCLKWLDDTVAKSVTDEEYSRREDALVDSVRRVLPPGFEIRRVTDSP